MQDRNTCRCTSCFGSHFAAYAQLDAGLGIGRTQLVNAENMTYTDTYFGPAFGAAAGLHVNGWFLPGFGASLGYAYDYAPVIKDLIGNTHASGGSRLTFALTYG